MLNTRGRTRLSAVIGGGDGRDGRWWSKQERDSVPGTSRHHVFVALYSIR